MSFTLLGTNSLTFLDGAELNPNVSSSLLFPEIRTEGGESTWLYLVNPADQPVDITLQWRNAAGTGVATVQQQLTAKAMLSGRVQDLFSSSGCPDPGCAGGSVRVLADAGVFGLEIFGNEDFKGGLQALPFDSAGAGLYAAHLASTSEIETVLNVVNLGEETVITATARSEAGTVIGTPVVLQIPAGGQWRQTARSAFQLDSDQVGWIEIHTASGIFENIGGGTIQGNISFGDPHGRFLASLPLQVHGSREFLLSHIAQTSQIFTGITLLNPGPGTALVTVEVFSHAGGLQGIAFLQIPAGEKRARLLTELIPTIEEQREGFIRVRSNQKIFGFEIFGDSGLEYFSAVPQQTVVH
jgi:hypothetical protein